MPVVVCPPSRDTDRVAVVRIADGGGLVSVVCACRYMDTSAVHVVLGAAPESTLLLDLPFNHIMYTGALCVPVLVPLSPASRRGRW